MWVPTSFQAVSRLGYHLLVSVLIGNTWNLREVFICSEHYSYTWEVCTFSCMIVSYILLRFGPLFPGISPFLLDKVVIRVSKGKMGTGTSPVWPGNVPEESQPQTQPFLNAWLPRATGSTHGVCWQPPSRLVWWGYSPEKPWVSLQSCSPGDFLVESPTPGWWLATWGPFHHSSLCSPVSCLLPPSCATRLDKSFCPIIPCSQSPWPHDYLCADCQAAEFLDPLILSLFFPRWEEGEEVLFFLQLESCPPWLGCPVPWVSSTTAGLQLAPRALQLPAMSVSHTGAARAVSWLANTAT